MTEGDLNAKDDRARWRGISDFAKDKAVRTTCIGISSVLDILDTSGGGGFREDLAPSAWKYLHSRGECCENYYGSPCHFGTQTPQSLS